METNYALIKNNFVVNIIVLDDPTEETLESFRQYHEADEIVFCQDNPRANVGGMYDGVEFIDLKPYESWVLNGWEWEAPVPYPTDGHFYLWDEETVSWALIEEREAE